MYTCVYQSHIFHAAEKQRHVPGSCSGYFYLAKFKRRRLIQYVTYSTWACMYLLSTVVAEVNLIEMNDIRLDARRSIELSLSFLGILLSNHTIFSITFTETHLLFVMIPCSILFRSHSLSLVVLK